MSNMQGDGVIDDVVEADMNAYKVNYGAHRNGISHSEMKEYYTEWAEKGTYEQDLCSGRYNGPQIAANTVVQYTPAAEQNCVRILDAAAGTGIVGKLLYDKGFRKLDALEPSSGMLELARKKEFYDRLICDGMGEEQCEAISDDTYDILVISGGMGEGHIPVIGLREMVRVVKPGGIVVIVMREEYLQTVAEYRGRLETYMDILQSANCWQREERRVASDYSFGKNGVVFVYRVSQYGVPGETCSLD